MEFTIRKAKTEDLPRIGEIYAYARSFMAKTGNPNQWGTTHPPREWLEDDIAKGKLYVITDDRQIHGVFYFAVEKDPTYAEIFEGNWHSSKPYGVIHRIAGDGSGGILKSAVAFAREKCDYLRIDTHHDNAVMQRALAKQGFARCGIIHLENGEPRIAFDRLSEECL